MIIELGIVDIFVVIALVPDASLHGILAYIFKIISICSKISWAIWDFGVESQPSSQEQFTEHSTRLAPTSCVV